jgi:hypothetical protein
MLSIPRGLESVFVDMSIGLAIRDYVIAAVPSGRTIRNTQGQP